MDIVVYGAGDIGLSLYNRIKDYYEDKYTIKAYIDAQKEGEVHNIPIIKLEQYDEKTPIIIAVGNRKIVLSIIKMLQQKNISNIYLYLNLESPCYDEYDFLESECIKIVGDANEMIHHIEMHAVDYCNLNCKACIHYAPLFNKEDFDEMMIYEDLKKLADFTTGIVSLYIMGGEPLLRDDLPNVIALARKLFPYTDIQVLTNGLLVPKCSEELWDVMRKNKIILTVSEYLPTQKLREDIKCILQKHKVPYLIRPYDEKNKFIKTLCLNEDSAYERTCICNGCINIYNGMIARCPAVMYINKLNETFHINLPSEGIYELSKMSSVSEVNVKMEDVIPLCEHCVYYEIEWENCGKNCKLEDFVIVK